MASWYENDKNKIPTGAVKVMTESEIDIYFDADTAAFYAIDPKRGRRSSKNLADLKRELRKGAAPVAGFCMYARNQPRRQEYVGLEKGRLRTAEGELLSEYETRSTYHIDEAAIQRLEELAVAASAITQERDALEKTLRRFTEADFKRKAEGAEA